tara:strand:- start:8446 stop:8904 length:459 start_codon:yes stop_codon:yes gene_type:complete
MKKAYLFIILISVTLYEANSQNNSNIYGDNFSSINVEDFTFIESDFPENIKMPIKIKGEILSTCPKKGCWMRIRAEEDTILVRFKDYGFFVPKQGVEGKEVIINGDLSVDTLTVPQLRHYAEDAGKTLREINKINDPEITLSFLATGVIIKE